MSDTVDASAESDAPAESGGVLGFIERVGNKVPTPAIMFVYLIAGLMVVSAAVAAFNVSVTDDVAIPVPVQQLEDVRGGLGGSIVPYDVITNEIVELPDYVIQEVTFEVRSLLDIEGLRFFFSSFVANFAAFGVVAVTLVAMAGVGVSEISGLMAALIRKIVKVAPASALAYIIILVGVVSSIATDAGYLILIPLGAAAFLSVGRHPLAGMAAAFGGVSAIFGVNLLITPTDSMITEITNEAIGSGGSPLNITANFYFGIVSTIVLAGVAAVVSARLIERDGSVLAAPRCCWRQHPWSDRGKAVVAGARARRLRHTPAVALSVRGICADLVAEGATRSAQTVAREVR